jgi:hypothetical protein
MSQNEDTMNEDTMNEDTMNEGTTNEDTVVAAVIRSFQERSRAGQLKYGTTLDRTDLSPQQWAQHMQEELMDAILYLERLKREMSRNSLKK